MSRRPPITLKRPEGGAEHGVLFIRKHGCAAAKLYKEGQDLEDFELIDELFFPVGLAGYEMPTGVPFEVVSLNECEACGVLVKAMFMWANTTVVTLS